MEFLLSRPVPPTRRRLTMNSLSTGCLATPMEFLPPTTLHFLVGANILYLFYCGVAWAGLWKNHN